MITVAKAVEEQVQKDEVALEAMRAGLLNLSSYADAIHKTVEERTFKEVKRPTIVVALSRVAKTILKNAAPLKPAVAIQNISVKSPICLFTYEKTHDAQRRIATLNPFLISIQDLLSVTEGVSEITMLCTERSKHQIQEHMGEKSKFEKEKLAMITVQFLEKYLITPNFLYALFSALATKRINIVEAVSTSTELSFVVEEKDMELVVTTLNGFVRK